MKNQMAIAVIISVTFQGCMKWEPGWQLDMDLNQGSVPIDLVSQADQAFALATDGPKLKSAIDLYRKASTQPQEAIHALNRLAECQILYGAAYAKSKREKRMWYREGIRFAERAMAENPQFRDLMLSETPLDEAIPTLREDDLKAMLLWVTGVSYYYKECLGAFGHIIHFQWVKKSQSMLNRMLELNRSYEFGAVLFSQAIYDIALPESVGGSLARAESTLKEAELYAEGSLLVRWGRAKYLHSRTGDIAEMLKDLNWVLGQDPKLAPSPLAWNIYFQEDARKMLRKLKRSE